LRDAESPLTWPFVRSADARKVLHGACGKPQRKPSLLRRPESQRRYP